MIGSLNTTHVTLSESGGVVREPGYDQYSNDPKNKAIVKVAQ